jgi:hypothetical protein
MIQLKYGSFVISIATKEINIKTYYNDSYKGVIIYDNTGEYDLIYHHKLDWNRMIISRPDGSYKDLPLHEGTFIFLPDYVKIERGA